MESDWCIKECRVESIRHCSHRDGDRVQRAFLAFGESTDVPVVLCLVFIKVSMFSSLPKQNQPWRPSAMLKNITTNLKAPNWDSIPRGTLQEWQQHPVSIQYKLLCRHCWPHTWDMSVRTCLLSTSVMCTLHTMLKRDSVATCAASLIPTLGK